MADRAGKPRVVAVTSGKGGVGKTNVALNLAVSLRLLEVQVLLLDADMGLGNVDVLLGLNVGCDLRDVVLDGRDLKEAVLEGPRGLKILPNCSGVEAMGRLSDDQVQRLLAALEHYCTGMDYLLVDTSPGISPAVVNCLLAADDIVLVTNPEPAALTDAYALLKVLNRHDEPERKRVHVVMNRVNSKDEAVRSFDRLRTAASKFLGRDVEYLGSVVWDDTVGVAARRQVDFLTHYSAAPCSRDVRKLAARLVSMDRPGEQNLGRFLKQMMEPADDRSA